MLSPPAWTLRAACRDISPEEADYYFFNYNGRTKALALCRRCPVRRECLQRCAEDEATWRWGVWGGLTADERARYVVDGKPDVEAALVAWHDDLLAGMRG